MDTQLANIILARSKKKLSLALLSNEAARRGVQVLNEQFMSRKHGVKVGLQKKLSFFLSILEAHHLRMFFFPLGGWFLVLVVKGFNPLTCGSCACFWLEL